MLGNPTTRAYKNNGAQAPSYAAPNGGIPRAPKTGAVGQGGPVFLRETSRVNYAVEGGTNQPYKYMPLYDQGAAQYVPKRWQALPKEAATGPGTVNQIQLRLVDPTMPVFLGAFNVQKQKLLVQGLAGVPASYPVMQPLYNIPRGGVTA